MNRIFILVGPSGAGKSTLASFILKDRKDFAFLTKLTTRPRRSGDAKQEFIFIDEEGFSAENDAKIIRFSYTLRGNSYGVLNSSIKQLQEKNLIGIIGDFDALGKMKKELAITAIYVRSTPETIAERLLLRVDKPEELKKSREAVEAHLSTFKNNEHLFEFVIDNDNSIEQAKSKLLEIIDQKVDQAKTRDLRKEPS